MKFFFLVWNFVLIQVAFCAVDCTKSQSLCEEYGIQGYPTIKYFSFGKFVSAYEDERTVKYLILT
jgi:thiol-disulfide isomerase/thioredoxin